VILSIFLSVVSCHVLSKRSLLGEGPHNHDLHHQAQGHGGQQRTGERSASVAAIQAPEGYLPPYEDYHDEPLGGYKGQGQHGDYEAEDQQRLDGEQVSEVSGEEEVQGQYGVSEAECDDQQGQYKEKGGSGEESQGQSGDNHQSYEEKPLPIGNNVEEKQSDSEKSSEKDDYSVDDQTTEHQTTLLDYEEVTSQYDNTLNLIKQTDNITEGNLLAEESREERSDSAEKESPVDSKTSNDPPSDSVKNTDSNSSAPLETTDDSNKSANIKNYNAEEGIEAQECPGVSIERCVKVCPGTTLRVYGACVNGCAERCSSS